MAKGPRKSIYYIGSVILAAILFLTLFFFDEDKDFQSATINSSLSGTSDSSDLGNSGLEEDSEQSGGGSEDDSEQSGGGSEEDSEQSGGGSEEDSDEETGEGGGSDGEGPNCLFRVYSEVDAFLYFRQDGLGTYTGNGYHGFTSNDRYYLGAGDLNPLYYFAQTLSQSGYTQYDVIVEKGSVKSELLPYYPLNVQSGNDGKSYTVSYYSYDYLTMGLEGLTPIVNNSMYKAQERIYRQFVEDTFLTITPSLCETLLRIAGDNGIEKNDLNVVHKVVNYVQNAAYYDYYYAANSYPSNVDMVTHFLTQEQRGVCRHYAAAATMMFRALGIPARYCIGFAVGVKGGEWTDVMGDGHAWTEIYIDGYGWVPLEVTGVTQVNFPI